jgi:hypothetical protein
MERQLCSSLTHAGTKYPAGQGEADGVESIGVVSAASDAEDVAEIVSGLRLPLS